MREEKKGEEKKVKVKIRRLEEGEMERANARDRYRCRICGRETDGILFLFSPLEAERFWKETGVRVRVFSAENMLTVCPACIIGRVERGLNTYRWKREQVLRNIDMQRRMREGGRKDV